MNKVRGRPFEKGHPSFLTPDALERVAAANRSRRGIPRTEEVKRKISLAQKGRKRPADVVEKVRLALIGKKQSKETIAKRFAWSAGYKHSEETKKKISESNKKSVHKTDESKRARKAREYMNWRKAVYERDNWTCQKCLIKGGKLHPHHIRNFAESPELRFLVDNGVTLCVDHHKKFHSEYGIRNNTAEQIAEFLK